MIDTGLAMYVIRETNLHLSFLVAYIAGFGLFIDYRPNLRTVRRDCDLSLLVEDSNLGNSLSLSHVINDPLIFVSPVLDHGIPDAQTDGLAEVESLLFCLVENLPGERVDIEIKEKPFDHQNDDDDAEKNLRL
jgi:hypothetical protein